LRVVICKNIFLVFISNLMHKNRLTFSNEGCMTMIV
jgi:hypothetical protein